MTDEDRRILTELLGECFHVWKNRLCDPNRKIETIPECETCGTICKWDGSTDNRTFTTWQDTGDLKKAIVGMGEWDYFIKHARTAFEEVQEQRLFHFIEDFTMWLMDEIRFPELVVEWAKERGKG